MQQVQATALTVRLYRDIKKERHNMETSKIPAISVVMSVYNGEKYLEKGISSIVNQILRIGN